MVVLLCSSDLSFFFFQAEDGIRDVAVTGVQTCALPISMRFQRANIVALRTSKMRPMPAWCTNAGARAKAPRGGESTGGCAEERAFGPVRQRLGELRLQDAHAPQLPAQAALDLAQSGLKLQLLPVLAHGALLLAEPLILDAGPVRERCEEALVLVRHARAQLLEVRASGMAAAPGTAARARGKCDRR